MPTACGAPVKYMWVDHEPVEYDILNPGVGTWHTVFDKTDVRLLWFVYKQTSDEAANHQIRVRWIIDGTTYEGVLDSVSDTKYYVYKDYRGITLLLYQLTITSSEFNATKYIDKRGHDFKIEIRIELAQGTNQYIETYAVWERLEQVAP